MKRENFETSKNKNVEEQKDKIIADMDKEVKEEEKKEEVEKVEKKRKIDNKSVFLSGEYVKTDRGWRREGETDKD